MKIENIKDLIPFLDYLDSKSIFYTLDKLRQGAIIVKITLLEKRIELEIFEDGIEYCEFIGPEDVDPDSKRLFESINDFLS